MKKNSHRLAKKKDIDNVFKNGRSFYDNLLGVKAVKNNEAKYRLAFVISSKVSKKAVVRNKIRRRLNEIIRTEFSDKIKYFDLIVIVLPLAKDKKMPVLRSSLLAVLNRLSLLN